LDRVGKEYLSSLRESGYPGSVNGKTKGAGCFVQMHRMFSPLDEEISCAEWIPARCSSTSLTD